VVVNKITFARDTSNPPEGNGGEVGNLPYVTATVRISVEPKREIVPDSISGGDATIVITAQPGVIELSQRDEAIGGIGLVLENQACSMAEELGFRH